VKAQDDPVVVGVDGNNWGEAEDMPTADPPDPDFGDEHNFHGLHPDHGLVDTFRLVANRKPGAAQAGPAATHVTGRGKSRRLHRMDRIYASRSLMVVDAGIEEPPLGSGYEPYRSHGSDHALVWATFAAPLDGPSNTRLSIESELGTSASIEWLTVGVLPDCAVLEVGDPSVQLEEIGRDLAPTLAIASDDGRGLVVAYAGCDGLPVELGNIGGKPVAVRLEFVSDVAYLIAGGGGTWQQLGRLRLGRTGCVARDRAHVESSPWSHTVQLPEGWYTAESFVADGECLGIRLVRE
jgi:hypothetical protein